MSNEPSSPSSNNSATGFRSSSHEEISRRAEELWNQYGRPVDRDEEIWLEAERQLAGSSGSAINPEQSSASNGTADSNVASSTQPVPASEIQEINPPAKTFSDNAGPAVVRSGGRTPSKQKKSSR